MKVSTPRWWYLRQGRPGPVTRALLRPASWVWAWATAYRLARGRKVDPGVPVICVGNLTLGGTGKTPVVRELALMLKARGVDARILTRGYGGRLAGPIRVDSSAHTAADVGDEPLMLAGEAEVWIARRRDEGAKAAASAGAEVIIMDDGHQNADVTKALSIVVVDGETRDGEWPFGDGAVFPAGPLREPLAAGLARADAVVMLLSADAPAPDPALMVVLSGRPVLIAWLEPDQPAPAGALVAFAGIGKPWKFERALRAAGGRLAEFVALPDHARLDERTLRALEAEARRHQARLVTTEKDWVRLPSPWQAKVTPWRVRARFEDPDALDRLLDRYVRR